MFQPLFAALNPVDVALVAFLVLAFPALQIASTLRPKPKAPRSLTRRYLRSGAILGVPLIVLAIDWLGSGRGAAALGLALPPPFRGQIGLWIAVFAVVVLTLMTIVQSSTRDPRKLEAMRAQMKAGGLSPETPRELALGFVYAFIVGCGSEVLFRGFLLWAFIPLAGLAGAVAIAALAYGIGHGFRNRRQALIAVLSAVAFTLAYALTLSLWWLMAIHTFAALQASWSGYRLSRRA